MLIHWLRTFLRSFWRHKLSSVINLLGLAVAIAVFVILMLFVRFETRFESWLPRSENIFAVRQTWNLPGVPPQESFSTSGALLEAVQSDFPGTEGVRVMDQLGTVRLRGEAIEEPLRLVDGNFLEIFPFRLSRGSAAGALARPDGLVLSERLASKYFGSADVLGRSLRIAIGEDQRVYQVTGVLAPMPAQSELRADLFLPLVPERQNPGTFRHWGSTMLQTFLRFADPAEAATFERGLPAMIRRRATPDIGPQAAEQLRLRLVPLRSMHLIEPEDRAMVTTLGLVGLLTLLVACINYVTLATARAVLRAKEIAVRKVVGATRGSLMLQFLGEALATVTLAACLGLALAELILPSINATMETDLELSYFGPDGILPEMLLALLAIGLLAGTYPAFLLSRFQPAAVLASSREPGGGRSGTWIRETLVVIQFAVAVAFMIATAIVFSQTSFMRRADLGFDRSGLLLVSSLRNPQLSEPQRESFLARAGDLPGILSVTLSDAAPGDENVTNSAAVGRPGMRGERPPLHVVTVGRDFFAAYGVRPVAGRPFNENFGMDDLFATRNIPLDRAINNAIVNRAALRTLGFAGPAAALGQKLEIDVEGGRRQVSVIGVVENIRFRSPRGEVPPTVYLFQSREMTNPVGAIRFSGRTPIEMESQLRRLWRSLAPDVPFQATTAESNLSQYYKADVQRSQVFIAASLVAILISCLGLYGLASFSAARRTREIGIRKALGATTGDILRLMIGQMLRPVLLANLVAWPLAFLAMRRWLNGFDQRIDIDPLIFLGAAWLALAIAAATVWTQVLKASRTRPAEALRTE